MRNSALLLLQTFGLSEFQIRPKPIQGVIFVVGVAAIVFLIVYLNKSKKVKNSAIFKTGTIDKTQLGALGVKGLAKIALKYGLDGDEQKALAKALLSAGLDVSTVFKTIEDIDNGFSKMVSTLSREDDSEDTIAKLFTARNKIEYYVSVSSDENNENAENQPSLSGKSGKNLTPRRYRRIKMNTPATFYLVSVTESRQGLKTVKKLSLDNNKQSGSVLDISAGGCSISTRNSVKAGARIKIEFTIGKSTVAALALILRVNKDAAGNVLHTRFIKVPAKTLNAVNALVYNYRDI